MDKLIPAHLTLAVATLVLNQGKHLNEWIELHSIMGFQLFIIFDDNSTDNTADILLPYIKQHKVIMVNAKQSFPQCASKPTNTNHRQAECQQAVLNYARNQLEGKTTWMGNFDVDEFIWTPRGAPSLNWLLKVKYAEYDIIHIVGTVFGNSNVTKNDYKSVISTFNHRAHQEPYLFFSYSGARFGHKSLYRPQKIKEGRVNIHDVTCYTCNQIKIYPLANTLRMNHYQYKSRQEQLTKAITNGNHALDPDPMSEALMNEVEDNSIAYLLPRLWM
jgi:hypothetical protein